MRTVHVPLGNRSYDIKIAPGLIDRLGSDCARLNLGSRCAIITDTNVGRRYAKDAFNSLATKGFLPSLIIVQPGEAAKSLKTVQICYDQLAAHRLERKSFIVALGGGVVGDLAGFVAATYLRGIAVRAGADDLARAGGQFRRRQGRDQFESRQESGRRVLPAAYWCSCDLDTLKTLPDREFRAGLAEVIKYGIIYDARSVCADLNATCRSCSNANQKRSPRSLRAAAKSRRKSSARMKPKADCARS